MNDSRTQPQTLEKERPGLTNTTRRLYLRSSLADINTSFYNKTWILPQTLKDASMQYRVVMRNLNLFHQFPSVPRETTLIYLNSLNVSTIITIYEGNWDAYSLANYLTDQLASESIKVTYDEGLNKFLFDPSIQIEYVESLASRLLGIPDSITGNLDRSVIPINMCPIRNIVVNTNLSMYNIPINNRLSIIPVEYNFNDLIQYKDQEAQSQPLIMDHAIKFIQIQLTDEDGVDLEEYLQEQDVDGYTDLYPEWTVILELTPVENPGFIQVAT